ncbi:MAG: hypothetical protein LQ343_002915 [Gyalolechia ehrenbergii]|nr:MAG: hypothetical protein LQ343_002915 [Gyalolechia ehrenbergii]
MRVSSIFTSLLASSSVASAIPASNLPSTALTQGTADTSNGSNPIPNPFNIRFPVPDTSTVLWLAQGRPANPYPLGVLLLRAQRDVNDLILQYGPQAIPGDINAPKYSYLTTTPGGLEGYFFITALSRGGLTYQLVKETLSGLRIYLMEQGRNEQPVFEVESLEGMEAFGGVSVYNGVAGIQRMSNRTDGIASDPPSPFPTNPIDVHLQCTFARPLPPVSILQLLHLARVSAASKIREEGPDAFLPGAAGGEWEVKGDFGAEFVIFGVLPHRLTWQIMAGTVEGLKAILLGGQVLREAQCYINVGEENVGGVLVREVGGGGIGP